jgi:hypothetical protein
VLRFLVLSLLDRSELAAVGGARPPTRRSSEEDHP